MIHERTGLIMNGNSGFRSVLSELLMRLAMWTDPTGHRAETAVPPGMDRDMPRMRLEPVEPPYSDADPLRPAVPTQQSPTRRPRPASRGNVKR